ILSTDPLSLLDALPIFSPIADTDDTLISLQSLQRRIEIDAEARTVTVDGGATYADVAPVLHASGFALANVASLPNITLAGAVVRSEEHTSELQSRENIV